MSRRRGFTIVELIAALGLGGVLLLTAGLAMRSVTGARATLSSLSAGLQREGVGTRMLQELLLMAQSAEAGAPPFFGDSLSTAFRSRCRSPGGWSEPCDVLVQIERRGGRSVIQARLGGRAWQEVVRYDGPKRLEYLELRDTTARWVSVWGSSISRPHAVALRDSLTKTIFRTGVQ